jgi:ADP-ribose pyrophosphatase
MLQRWKQLTTKIFHENPWWHYKHDTFTIPEGVSGDYYYVETNGSSMIVPIDADGRIILVNQYRYLCDRESIELPCGGIKAGKSPEEMAKIELEEETGFTCGALSYIGSFNPFNGVTNEMCYVYTARDLTPVNVACDSTEEFEVMHVTLVEVEAMIDANEIWDGMTLAALAMARKHLADIHQDRH